MNDDEQFHRQFERDFAAHERQLRRDVRLRRLKLFLFWSAAFAVGVAIGHALHL